MVYVLFGPPGAGKGTQGVRIAAQHGVPTISTGAIFRDNVQAGTPLGLVAKDYMSKGQLVPDEVVVQLVKDRIGEPDCTEGFLLDGFPRTINQAEILEVMLGQAGVRIDGVLDFEVEEDELVRRLSGRRTCGKCGATYHVVAVPPRVAGVCDQCGGDLQQRTDDMPDAIRTRLREYQAKTAPVLTFYRERGLLREIDANASPDEIYARVEVVVGDPVAVAR